MIDPVGNGYSSYQRVETKIETQAGRTLQGGEKFTLDYQKGEAKDQAKEAGEAGGGVVLELSGQQSGQKGRYGQQDAGPLEPAESSFSFAKVLSDAREFLKRVTGRLSGLWQQVRTALLDFWNSDTGVKVETVKQETPDKEEEGIQNVQENVSVKKSDLLTYYDRRGKLVKLSGSDRNRILRGDHNSLEG